MKHCAFLLLLMSLIATGCPQAEEDPDPSPKTDCNGDEDGDAFLDECDMCVGGATDKEACEEDCNGDFGGDAHLDACDQCVGGETGEVPCDPNPPVPDAGSSDGIMADAGSSDGTMADAGSSDGTMADAGNSDGTMADAGSNEETTDAGGTATIMGCTDDDATNYNALANTDDASCKYTVTFTVDMGCSDYVLQTGDVPHVQGLDTDWGAAANSLTDDNADGIWSGTYDIAAGTYEYKISVGHWNAEGGFWNAWEAQENLEGLSECAVNLLDNNWNREITIIDGPMEQTIAYGQCGVCTCRRNDGQQSMTYTVDGGPDEEVCEDILCGLNEQVSNHVCVPCAENLVNTEGDNAAGDDTQCETAGCTDPLANNFNPDAMAEDNSCTYDISFVANLRCANLDADTSINIHWGPAGDSSAHMLALTDEDNDGLWTGATQAPNGDYVYLMATEANNTNLDIEDLSGEGDEDENCAVITTENDTTVWARPFMVQQMPVALDATYGSCAACPPIHIATGTITWPDGEWQDVNGTITLVDLPGSVEVLMTNFEDVGGFEFELPGAELDPNATPSGGTSESQSFTLDIGSNEKVIGFSIDGNAVAPAENQLLVSVPLDGLDNDGVCFDNVIFSDAEGDMLDAQYVCQDGAPAAAFFSIGNIIAPTDSAEGSIEIMLTSHINVGGYQFEVSGLSLSNVNGGNVTGGLIDNLTKNSSLSSTPSDLINMTQVSNGIFLGFSISGDLVPSTDGVTTLFATLPISAIDIDATDACIINETISDYIGNDASSQITRCNPIP